MKNTIESYQIRISKNNDVWFAKLFQSLKVQPSECKYIDTVVSDSYSGLVSNVADKGWIDLVNSNVNY